MDYFNDVLVGQLVILAFLLIVTLRPLLKKTQNTETLALLTIIAFLLSILFICVYSLSVLAIFLLLLSLVVFLTNIPSLYRVVHSLYADRYSIQFCIVSYVEAFCIAICVGLCIIFQPVPTNSALKQQELYTGSFSRGFTQKTNFANKTNVLITEYSRSFEGEISSLEQMGAPVVVYLSPIGTTSADASLRLQNMASMGLTVYTGDFFSTDAPKTGTILDMGIYNNPILKPFVLHFMPPLRTEQREAFLSHRELELEALLSLAGQKYSSVIIFTEGETRNIALKARQKYPSYVLGVFSITEDDVVEEYYGRGIADFILLNPLDALFSKFDESKEFFDVRKFATVEQPHLRIARLLTQRVEDILEVNKNDTK